jgi:NADPH-dependent F420 reductase
MTEEQQPIIKKIAIVGGTGKEGKGLAYRWSKAGYEVIIGSRQKEKADAAVAEIQALPNFSGKICGMENQEAACMSDLVVMTVPFSAHKAMLEAIKPSLQGKIMVDVTVPIVPPKVTRVQMPPAGSAAQEAQEILGDAAQVVSAFQNISYENLIHDQNIQCDVLVCGKTKAAREIVIRLVHAAGLIGWDAGPLENSMVVEGMTSILIGINKQYGVQSAGIMITGVSRPDR